ncbi:hypothetical protein [Pengzhenrongella sp.]|jgi:hypothetical protein|uniref:hypothetical protein n=1 Tax=Pengzhenrongella sp. TaxID=2888820 RepID=UPI002F9399FB
MWSRILRDQLHVTAEEFWACVTAGVLPRRNALPTGDPAKELPAALIELLIRHVGVPEDEIRGLTRDQALARLNEFWSSPPRPGPE